MCITQSARLEKSARWPGSFNNYVVLRCSLHRGFRIGSSPRIGCRRPLHVGCVPGSIHGAAGTGVFAYPHPLHNIFGISELIGYQAPLVFALTWRSDSQKKLLIPISRVLYALICVAIAANLTSLDRAGVIWA